jgi:hypothetical protein
MNTPTTTTKTSSQTCSVDLSPKIFLTVCPVLLIFGTFTNIFTLFVLSTKRMLRHSTYVYLFILAIADLFALWLGLVRDYLAHGFSIYITSTWLCKLHSFFFYLTLDFSSWILVAVSLDRLFAVTYVFSAHHNHFFLTPKVLCTIIFTFLFIINLHLVYFVEGFDQKLLNVSSGAVQSIGISNEYFNCVINNHLNHNYLEFLKNIWPYIDLSLYTIIPFCIMFICNIGIIRNVRIAMKNTFDNKGKNDNYSEENGDFSETIPKKSKKELVLNFLNSKFYRLSHRSNSFEVESN